MRRLLCELHAHSTWSDGELSIRELANLYGQNGFDVLAVTDHVLLGRESGGIHRRNFRAYLDEIESQAERAWRIHRLLVLPGIELTDDDPRPDRAAHALAIGLREFMRLEHGLEEALRRAGNAGALLVGAHPYALDDPRLPQRGTARFMYELGWARRALHRFELVNRFDVFGWVSDVGLPYVATGDFHRTEHLSSWKTVLSCRLEEDAILEHLRSSAEVELLRISVDEEGARAA